MQVSYIGLGLMGFPIATNLLKAGWPLTVFNRTASKASPLVKQGARLASTPLEAARDCDVIFTNLPDSAEVMEIVFGPNGIARGMKPGSILVDNSTISPKTARIVAQRLKDERAAFALDAPVSGGDVGAKAGTLSIMVGGDKAAFQRVLPLLMSIGKRVSLIGGPGAGQVCKAANQIMVSQHRCSCRNIDLRAAMWC